MSFENPVMLTFAALAYRGFNDVFTGTLHQDILQEALIDGLNMFEPVRGQWELVWGPAATRRAPLKNFRSLDVFDWNAMYVVRNLQSPNKYVVAIRGTNPIAGQDWLFGDLWINTSVRWPYGTPDEVISGSTALGLAALQNMHSAPPRAPNNAGQLIAKATRDLLHGLARSGQRALKGLVEQGELDNLILVQKQLDRIVQHWFSNLAERKIISSEIQRLSSEELISQDELRPRLMPKDQRDGDLDLLTFLATQVEKNDDPLEVTITGHSKGGALAPTVALWLKEAMGYDEECWDRGRRATVRFHAFAGPTPGNAAFADRLDATIGDSSHYLVNTNDIVPQAYQVDMLERLPDLYADRSRELQPLVQVLIEGVAKFKYQHPAKGRTTFAGELNPKRPFAAELIHQHLDAYLQNLGLFGDQINAFTCFV
jgi:hypothetical protein